MRRTAPSLAAGLLLALFWWMAASVSREHSTTADEIFHVTAGHSYWTFGDFRLQPENGNLPQRLAALPLLTQDLRFPKRDQPAWRTADAAEIGHQFFHESGNDLPRMLASARAAIALLGVACGVLVFAWARSLFGPAGALVSVVLFAFCPLTLAHAGLATSDMAATLGFFAATLTGWRLLHRATPERIMLAGLAWGGLALAKFSAPLFAAMFAAMAAIRLMRSRRRIGAVTTGSAAALLLALVLVWAAYGFRFDGLREPGAYNHPWNDYGTSLTVRAAALARDLRLLPEPWLQGLAHTAFFAQGRPAFFLGEFGSKGWLLFFPVAFVLKATVGQLGLLALTGWGLLRTPQARRHAYRLAPLAVLLVVYGGFALTSRLNIGLRHLLPVFPALYVLAGAVVWLPRRTWVYVAVGALGLAHVLESCAIRPHYLAQFNPLFGGPAVAYRRLVDSSLDWGQDLPGLKRWLDPHTRGEKIFLSYFGSGSPAHEGIRATRLADGYFDLRGRELLPEMTGGLYCISATMFQQIYTHVRHGWTADHERRYADLTRWVAEWRAGRDRTPRDAAIPRMVDLEHLRFGRLCAGLQPRAPDHLVGYSILIFRLTEAEVRALLDGPPPYFP
ncbi:MAG: glycosyltransferase family 39 protein [Verrucomicrobia bacterium]|nr:glycosyltransferase family 39 protein [Verrucomicrobiota bacterium]